MGSFMDTTHVTREKGRGRNVRIFWALVCRVVVYTRGGQAQSAWLHGGRQGCRATGLQGGVCFTIYLRVTTRMTQAAPI